MHDGGSGGIPSRRRNLLSLPLKSAVGKRPIMEQKFAADSLLFF